MKLTKQIGTIKTLFKTPNNPTPKYQTKLVNNLKHLKLHMPDYWELSQTSDPLRLIYTDTYEHIPEPIPEWFGIIIKDVGKIFNVMYLWDKKLVGNRAEPIRIVKLVGLEWDVELFLYIIRYLYHTTQHLVKYKRIRNKHKSFKLRKQSRKGKKVTKSEDVRLLTSNYRLDLISDIHSYMTRILDIKPLLPDSINDKILSHAETHIRMTKGNSKSKIQ